MSRSTSELTATASIITAGGITSTNSSGNVNTVTGSFGAQYAMSRRLSVFGEVGLGYTHTGNTPTGGSKILVTTSITSTYSTRSGAGVV